MLKNIVILIALVILVLKHLVAFTPIPFFLQANLTSSDKSMLQTEVIFIDCFFIIIVLLFKIFKK